MPVQHWTSNAEAKRILKALVRNPEHLRAGHRGASFSEGLGGATRVTTYVSETDFAWASLKRLQEIVEHFVTSITGFEPFSREWILAVAEQPTVDQAIGEAFERKAVQPVRRAA